MDENVEYEERESEFDITDEDKEVESQIENQIEEVEVDVTSCEAVAAFCSSDEEDIIEEESTLQFLPIAPEVEDPEEGWGAPGAMPVQPQSTELGKIKVRINLRVCS